MTRPRANPSRRGTQGAQPIVSWISLPMGLAMLFLAVSCGPSRELRSSRDPAEPRLAPMFVADLAVDITVADFNATLQGLDFVSELGGHMAAVGMEDYQSTKRMIVELRVPHREAGHVADILKTKFGQVTNIYAFSADVSVRNARLRRELAALEESLGQRSGDDLEKARDRIELLKEMITFQLEREAFLFVTIRLVESR